MNQNILRGFCQKCGMGVELDGNLAFHIVVKEITWPTNFCGGPDPVWFLSPKQIYIVRNSEIYINYCTKNGYTSGFATTVAEFLKDEPFLVAKILKEAEEKEAINNLRKLPKDYRDEILKEEP